MSKLEQVNHYITTGSASFRNVRFKNSVFAMFFDGFFDVMSLNWSLNFRVWCSEIGRLGKWVAFYTLNVPQSTMLASFCNFHAYVNATIANLFLWTIKLRNIQEPICNLRKIFLQHSYHLYHLTPFFDFSIIMGRYCVNMRGGLILYW